MLFSKMHWPRLIQYLDLLTLEIPSQSAMSYLSSLWAPGFAVVFLNDLYHSTLWFVKSCLQYWDYLILAKNSLRKRLCHSYPFPFWNYSRLPGLITQLLSPPHFLGSFYSFAPCLSLCHDSPTLVQIQLSMSRTQFSITSSFSSRYCLRCSCLWSKEKSHLSRYLSLPCCCSQLTGCYLLTECIGLFRKSNFLLNCLNSHYLTMLLLMLDWILNCFHFVGLPGLRSSGYWGLDQIWCSSQSSHMASNFE